MAKLVEVYDRYINPEFVVSVRYDASDRSVLIKLSDGDKVSLEDVGEQQYRILISQLRGH